MQRCGSVSSGCHTIYQSVRESIGLGSLVIVKIYAILKPTFHSARHIKSDIQQHYLILLERQRQQYELGI